MRVLSFYLLSALCLSTTLWAQTQGQKSTTSTTITVYRSPSCGCCGEWVAHLKQHQFTVIDNIVDDVQQLKAQHAVPTAMASCHTALVDGYVIEGHVPAQDIKQLLAKRPKITGIAVPGMPVGTPGMEMGTHRDAYQVLSFDKQQHIEIFNTYRAE